MSRMALRKAHDRHAPVNLRYVMSLTGSWCDAEDITQETFLKAWRQPRLLKSSPERVRAWMLTVAQNLAIDRARSARRRREELHGETPETPTGDKTEELLNQIMLREAFGSISKQHQEGITKAHFEGKSIAELSMELKIPEGTVKSRLHYGMRALRQILKER